MSLRRCSLLLCSFLAASPALAAAGSNAEPAFARYFPELLPPATGGGNYYTSWGEHSFLYNMLKEMVEVHAVPGAAPLDKDKIDWYKKKSSNPQHPPLTFLQDTQAWVEFWYRYHQVFLPTLERVLRELYEGEGGSTTPGNPYAFLTEATGRFSWLWERLGYAPLGLYEGPEGGSASLKLRSHTSFVAVYALLQKHTQPPGQAWWPRRFASWCYRLGRGIACWSVGYTREEEYNEEGERLQRLQALYSIENILAHSQEIKQQEEHTRSALLWSTLFNPQNLNNQATQQEKEAEDAKNEGIQKERLNAVYNTTYAQVEKFAYSPSMDYLRSPYAPWQGLPHALLHTFFTLSIFFLFVYSGYTLWGYSHKLSTPPAVLKKKAKSSKKKGASAGKKKKKKPTWESTGFEEDLFFA